MSRLFDALQSARPDITEKFEAPRLPESGVHSGPVVSGPRSGRFDEAFLPLIEKLERSGDGEGGRVVGFAGLHGGEGATTVVMEFAGFIAEQLQLPVLALEVRTDPSPTAVACLSDLTGAADEHAALYAHAALVVPQRTQPAPGELRQLLAPLSNRHDWILIDCGALLARRRPAAALASLGRLVVVAEAGRSHSRDLARAARIVQAAGGQVAGMVLNKRPNRIPRLVRSLLARLHLS